MAKAKSFQTTNSHLLYARVIRADGTKTFINKVNANGYGTDAKGPQIHKTRIVQAGRTLKELPEALPKTECVLVGGIAHKLNKKQQKLLAAGDQDFVSEINVDLERLQFVEPDTATTSRRATRHTPDTIAKRVSKRALKDATGKAEKQPTAKQARKRAKAEGIEVDMLDKKGQTASRKRDRKADTSESIIKQMPRELKRLISDGQLKLNNKQISQVLTSLGLDAEFYATAVEANFGGLSLVLPERKQHDKATKKAKPGKSVAQYASKKEVRKLLGKLKTKLVAPTVKHAAAHKQRVKEIRKFWQNVFGLASPLDVKPGLLIIDDYGDKYALVAIDHVSTVFVKLDGTNERLVAHSLLSHKSGHAKFTLLPADELDVAV